MRQDAWGPLAGIAFAVLFVAGLLLPNLPVGGEAQSDETIRAFYEDAGDRMQVVIATYLLVLAALAFAVFVVHLYNRLQSAEPSAGGLALVALVAGVVAAAMIMAGAAALGALAAGISLGGEPEQLGDTGVARFTAHVGYGLVLLCAALSAALLMVVTSILGLRTGVLPTWLSWGGFVTALILLFGVIFLPMIALPLWVLAVSVVALRRPEPAANAVRP